MSDPKVYKAKKSYGKKLYKPSMYMAPRSRTEFVKQVQSIISKDVETKMAFHSQAYYAKVSGITAVNDILRILPAIANGTGPCFRIGDQLKCQSLTISGNLLLNPQMTTTFAFTRVAVRIMVVSSKRYPTYADATGQSNWLDSLLQKGTVVTNFSGIQSDLFAPLNREVVTVHADKVYYMDAPFLGTTAGYAQGAQDTIKYFNIKIPCKGKVLKYDPNISSSLLPSNFGPVLLFGYVFMDGTAPTTVFTPVSCQYVSTFNFEDA